MNTFKQLLNECIENEASYFRNGEKKQEVIDYVEALERKVAQLEAQIEAVAPIDETPVMVELVEIETPIANEGERIYEVIVEYQDTEGEAFAPRHRIAARDFLDANGIAHSIRDREHGGRDKCRIVMIRELE